MWIALTHAVSPKIGECELTYLERRPIDHGKAVAQHEAYCDLLRACGLEVIELTGNLDFPDSTFIEDAAVVVDEIAVMASMGAASRRGEVPFIESELGRYRKTARIGLPATLEGGDVLRVGRRLFAGLSGRTNRAGVESLRSLLAPFGYEVVAVPVDGCLHLKSAVGALDEGTLLANPEWVDSGLFREYDVLHVAEGEFKASNVLRAKDTVVMSRAFPKTVEAVRSRGFRVKTLDISELQKAESGLTCSSLLLKTRRPP